MRRSRSLLGLGAAGLVLLSLPLLGLLLRAPWSRLGSLVISRGVTTPLRLSLETSFLALAVVAVVGTPVAYLLANTGPRLSGLLRGLVLVPLVLPPVVAGIALLLAFGKSGLLGGLVGSQLAFTTAAAVLAEAFVALPFYALTVEAALRSVDPDLAAAAALDGAGAGRILLRITLPAVRPAVGAGLALAFARALGEFGATVTFAGSLPGRTQTLPLAAYEALQNDPDAATALALVLVAVSITIVVLLRAQLRPGLGRLAARRAPLRP